MNSDDTIIDMEEARIRLIRAFDLAGRDGARNWPKFIRLARSPHFTDFDFQRQLSVSRSMLRQWGASAGCPPESLREAFRRTIVTTLERRRDQRDPTFPRLD
jgi:hypothetical protein